MKKNEEIIYNIIKKNVIVIILIPVLAVGGYLGYVKTKGASVYTTSATLLVDNLSQSGTDTPTDRYYAITNAVADLAKSSVVIDQAASQLGDIKPSEIVSMMKVEARSFALTVKIDFTSPQSERLLNITQAVTKNLASYSNTIYGGEIVKIVDRSSEVTKKSAALSKVKLIGVGGIAFIVTLFAVLSLNWKKESR